MERTAHIVDCSVTPERALLEGIPFAVDEVLSDAEWTQLNLDYVDPVAAARKARADAALGRMKRRAWWHRPTRDLLTAMGVEVRRGTR
jgi:hypothetical protein